MKLLLTGAEGQLGKAFVAESLSHQDIELICYNRANLDITREEHIASALALVRPDFVINAAAFTEVDLAEVETEKAFAVNKIGPANLAKHCASLNIPLIHFSTDYVFDGVRSTGWREEDLPSPLNSYGASKLAGECEIKTHCTEYLIFRTSWLFSPFGENFLTSMLRLGAEREELSIVNDQHGRPTSALELARLVVAILPHVSGRWGVYHLAQPEVASWWDFANSIFTEARQMGFGLAIRQVNPIASSHYPTEATRPSYSNLSCEKFERSFGLSPEPWRQSLISVMRRLHQDA
jgi:dTDP-4-dehydrorhamnose reductase